MISKFAKLIGIESKAVEEKAASEPGCFDMWQCRFAGTGIAKAKIDYENRRFYCC